MFFQRRAQDMQQVSIDCADALAGEEAFIVQLRPPAPNIDEDLELANNIDRYMGMLLESCDIEEARFAHLGPLTWSIVCHRFSAEPVKDLIAQIGVNLFDDANSSNMKVQRKANEDEDMWALPEPSAATKAAFSDDEAFDLDGAMNEPEPAPGVSEYQDPVHFSLDAIEVDYVQDPSALSQSDHVDEEAPVMSAEPTDELDIDDFGPNTLGSLPNAIVANLDEMTESPAPSGIDVRETLDAFRQEMREIAQSIPGQDPASFMAEFKAELESLSGEIGQRVDGAAQRIESAAQSVVDVASPQAGERFNAAAERAEKTANLLEATTKEAVAALQTLMKSSADLTLDPSQLDDIEPEHGVEIEAQTAPELEVEPEVDLVAAPELEPEAEPAVSEDVAVDETASEDDFVNIDVVSSHDSGQFDLIIEDRELDAETTEPEITQPEITEPDVIEADTAEASADDIEHIETESLEVHDTEVDLAVDDFVDIDILDAVETDSLDVDTVDVEAIEADESQAGFKGEEVNLDTPVVSDGFEAPPAGAEPAPAVMTASNVVDDAPEDQWQVG